MQIMVQLPNGKTITLDISLEASVSTLKSKLSEKYGLVIEDQHIYFKDKKLKNDDQLKSVGVEAESKLVIHTAKTLEDMYQEKLRSAQEEKQITQNQLEDARLKIENLNEKIIDFQRKNKEIERREQDYKNQLESAQEEIQTLTKQNKKLNLQSTMQQADEPVESRSMRQSSASGFGGLDSETLELKLKIQHFESELSFMERQINDLKQEKAQLQMKVQEGQKYKEELIEKKFEVKSLNRDLEQMKMTLLNNDNDKSVREQFLAAELEKQRRYYEALEDKYRKLEDQNKELLTNNIKREYEEGSKHQKIDAAEQALNLAEQEKSNLRQEIVRLKQQIQIIQTSVRESDTRQVNMLSSTHERNYQAEINNLRDENQKLRAELVAKQSAFDESQIQLSKARKDIHLQTQKLKEQEQSLDGIRQILKDKDVKVKEAERTAKQAIYDKDEAERQSQFLQNQIQKLRSQGSGSNVNSEIERNMAEFERMKELKMEKQRQEQLELKKKEEYMLKRTEEINEENSRIKSLIETDKNARVKLAQMLKKQMMETHGKIEVCFLVDVTASMDPYKESAMACIDQSILSIKKETNRDVLWAAVAYQDFGELKNLKGLYYQIGFTPNGAEVQKFMRGIACQGGGDFAEDVRGGIKQMINNLKWSKTFKIAILICDAPTHGKRYNGGVSDRYPDEDIQDAIELLISNNILFVGVLFNKVTFQMFEEIKKIYKEYDREELLLLANLEGTEQGKIWQELVNLVSQASQRATQTNNKGTKTKNPLQNKKSQDGAMEALCKIMKDPSKFDSQPGVKVIKTKFQVFRIEIKQDAFETKIEKIDQINLQSDYAIHKEGQWQCIRTERPFAFGQVKSVYLMKKDQSGPVELYVIKMPLGDKTYQTFQEAQTECRSHLVSQCLMKKFMKDLDTAKKNKNPRLRIPQLQYSDFLILQEGESNSFWIAERFFNGDFVKYNNNYGFVSEEDSEINHLAQAFTYYTYFISNFNYMISDIQGVGSYFTDPAVNTKSGSYDDTDMGQDGQSMFMVAHSGKSHLGSVFLELLDIKAK